MRVTCIENREVYTNVTVGKEYVVLAIEFFNSNTSFSKELGDFVAYRLRSDDGIVIPFPSNIFRITCNRMPTRWISFRESQSDFSIVPKEWAIKYFWDKYYNDDSEILMAFKREEQLVLSES